MKTQKVIFITGRKRVSVYRPLHLPIGKDAVDTYKNNVDKTSKEIDQWLAVPTSTDHDVLAN